MTDSTESSNSDGNDRLSLLLRHVISLGWIDNYPCDGKEGKHLRISTDCRLQFITGFLYEFRGELCMMTAGHVINALNALIKDGWRIESMSIQDGWGHGAKHHDPIPFHYDPDMTISVVGDKVDFGIIRLRESYRAQLEANEVVPFKIENWEAQPKEYDRYVMVGLPVQAGSLPKDAHLKKEFVAKVTAVSIDVVCDQNPPNQLLSKAPRFYGRLQSLDVVLPMGSKTLTDIDGMSGGPIFGVKKIKEQWQYWPVAIQSGWVKSERAIAGTYLTTAGLILERMMDEHLEQRASGKIPEQLPE